MRSQCFWGLRKITLRNEATIQPSLSLRVAICEPQRVHNGNFPPDTIPIKSSEIVQPPPNFIDKIALEII